MMWALVNRTLVLVLLIACCRCCEKSDCPHRIVGRSHARKKGYADQNRLSTPRVTNVTPQDRCSHRILRCSSLHRTDFRTDFSDAPHVLRSMVSPRRVYKRHSETSDTTLLALLLVTCCRRCQDTAFLHGIVRPSHARKGCCDLKRLTAPSCA